jgi:Iap family predicted aminopeptidase
MKRNQILEKDIDRYVKAVDIDYQIDFVKAYEKIGDSPLYGGIHCGSDAEHEGSKFIADQLKKIGVEKVELIPCKTARYQFNDASLTVEGDADRIIRPYGYVSPGTESSGITAPIVDGIKARKTDLAKVDIKGKITLIEAMGTLEGANLSGQIEMAIQHGAAAVLICAVEDVLNDETIRVQPPNIICTVPVVGICKKDAAWIREKLSEGPCTGTLVVDAEFDPTGGTTYNVVGEIPGTVSDEKIIYTAHLDHYFRCLQDNISSCSSLLGIAKGIIDSGYKPNRSIIFAFHGSHETGGQDTRYPYIYGSYKLTHEAKSEWSGKAIVDINFEYTANRMKKLQASAYLGANKMPLSYFSYSPELVDGGFQEKNPNPPQTDYYMIAWVDSISYHTMGIPIIGNDSISEQLYEGTGPYVGRDHSNYDNWEVFDTKILEDVSRYYGGLGLYLDSLPYILLDFTEQTNRLNNEINVDQLKALNMPFAGYFNAVKALESAAQKANRTIAEGNEAYVEALTNGMSIDEKKTWFDRAEPFNERLLSAYKMVADQLDRINAFDFIALESVTYLQNIKAFTEAKNSLEAGQSDQALKAILPVDLAASSYYFDEDIVEHMRKQICDPSYVDHRTWSAGRELTVLTLYDLVATYVEEAEQGKGFDKTIAALDELIQMETAMIPKAMDRERNCFVEMAEKLSE